VANLKSSKKDVRRTRRRTIRNVESISRITNATKAVRTAATREAAQQAFRGLTLLLDRAAQKDLIHWRKAARQKSRIAALLAVKFPAGQAV
jgi:small subunit ribosomal protein S20